MSRSRLLDTALIHFSSSFSLNLVQLISRFTEDKPPSSGFPGPSRCWILLQDHIGTRSIKDVYAQKPRTDEQQGCAGFINVSILTGRQHKSSPVKLISSVLFTCKDGRLLWEWRVEHMRSHKTSVVLIWILIWHKNVSGDVTVTFDLQGVTEVTRWGALDRWTDGQTTWKQVGGYRFCSILTFFFLHVQNDANKKRKGAKY